MSYKLVTVDLIRARAENLKQQREQLTAQINQLDQVRAQALANMNVLQGAIQICDELIAAADEQFPDVKDEPATPSSPDATGDSTASA